MEHALPNAQLGSTWTQQMISVMIVMTGVFSVMGPPSKIAKNVTLQMQEM